MFTEDAYRQTLNESYLRDIHSCFGHHKVQHEALLWFHAAKDVRAMTRQQQESLVTIFRAFLTSIEAGDLKTSIYYIMICDVPEALWPEKSLKKSNLKS